MSVGDGIGIGDEGECVSMFESLIQAAKSISGKESHWNEGLENLSTSSRSGGPKIN